MLSLFMSFKFLDSFKSVSQSKSLFYGFIVTSMATSSAISGFHKPERVCCSTSFLFSSKIIFIPFI